MAGWGEKFSKMTQTAVNKGKEVAEITKLNLDNNRLESEITTVSNQIGAHVVEKYLFCEDEIVGQKLQQIDELRAAIEANNAKIRELKNIAVCEACGAEVPLTGNFCDKCGAQIKKPEPVVEEAPAPEVKVCVNCGKEFPLNAAFCSECGAKLE